MKTTVVVIALVNAASALAAAFTASSLVRVVSILLSVASGFGLALFAAHADRRLERADRRLEEAHERIVELKYDVDQAALAANAAHLIASRPVLERKQEEEWETIYGPMEESIKNAAAWVWSLLTGRPSRRSIPGNDE